MMVAFFFNYWLLTLVLAIPAVIAAARVKRTFARYARVDVRSGLHGAEAAAAVLRAAGVVGVRIEPHRGFLSDHYDPRTKTLRLSPEVFDGRSVSAVAVAAHEAGHAIQDAARYAPLVWRSSLVPITNLGNHLWVLPFFLGLITGATGFVYLGILLFATVVLFQLVTLPTEFDASRRAKQALAATGIVTTPDEVAGVSRVLSAAALTYVAAALTAVVHLLYLLAVARR
ncbi:MAG: zinc metallopeptidase [Planctomycetota bacterium]|jgi:Zn-dependent membrane protease YugP